MFSQILVPLDGSALAGRAVPYAQGLAQRTGAQLLLVRAVETWAFPNGGRRHRREQELLDEAERELAPLVQGLKASGLVAASSVQPGEAAMVIAQARHSHQSDLIVMSTHGRGGLGRLAYGSVAERVLREGACPVLLIPPEAEQGWRSSTDGRVVVPLDGSAVAEVALAPAVRLARLFGAGLSLMQVIEPPPPAAYSGWATATPYEYLDVQQWAEEAKPYIQGVASQLQSEDFAVDAETLVGYAAPAIDQEVRSKSALAVVMASHGRSGIERVVLGSVAQGVVHRTNVPVLVIRPGAILDHDAATQAGSSARSPAGV